MEEILDERAGDDGKEYLVRWRGYGEDEDTWEPEANLDGCRCVPTCQNLDWTEV